MIAKLEELIPPGGQSRFEKKLRLGRARISKWKAGTGEPRAREALAMARELKVPLEWLVDPECGMPPPKREELMAVAKEVNRHGLTWEQAIGAIRHAVADAGWLTLIRVEKGATRQAEEDAAARPKKSANQVGGNHDRS